MITVNEMPLYWRAKETPGSQAGMPPERVPFTFDYDANTGLIIEKRSPELESLLADIYAREANVGFLQDGHNLLQTYGADFWRFLSTLVEQAQPQQVLEIGCGGCVLLERLKEKGCHVRGIDPSPIAVSAGQRKDIEIIQAFFPSEGLNVTPDLIYQVDVLEHVDDPVDFLKHQAALIADDGLIVVNVPNCSQSIAAGDISMALHQHVNMFDEASLANVYHAAGLEVVQLERSQYGSALYCTGRKAKKAQTAVTSDETQWHLFQQAARRSIDAFQAMANEVKQSSQSIGFFMPQRAFPYLGTMGWFDGFRVFDNNSVWHNKYLDGLDIPIENQQDLIKNPVEHLLIMSLTFCDELVNELQPNLPNTTMTTMKDILKEAGNLDIE